MISFVRLRYLLVLDLRELSNGLPAITPSFGSALAEVAGFCLESQGHTKFNSMTIRGQINGQFLLAWPQITEQIRRTWNDLQEATEYGATAVAVLLTRQELGYMAIERSPKGTGIDYWLGEDTNTLTLERKARLEISGILNGSSADVRARVREKFQQAYNSDDPLPVFVVVVEFGTPLAEVQRK